MWNAAVNYTLERSTLFVTVKNVFDELYIVDRTRGILPGSPRMLQAGVRVRFFGALHKSRVVSWVKNEEQ